MAAELVTSNSTLVDGMDENLAITVPVEVVTEKRSTREFICGWGAAFINVAVTFPINKLMFRQMLHGVETQQALDQLKHEGLTHVYRGILPPLIQKTCSVSIMFGTYEEANRLLKLNFPDIKSAHALALSGMISGTLEASLTPLERIQTLLQDSKFHNQYRNTAHAASELRKFGFREYYRGLTPILMRNGPSNVMFFGLRTEIRNLYPHTENVIGRFVEDFISGAFIGALISTMFYPVNVVKTRMQVQVSGRFQSFSEVFKTIYDERRSFRKIFYGVHLNYTRALISWGIINASYELLQTILPENW